jgi:hypothetical protein
MFAGGGMVAPMQQPWSGMQQPMGILASSQPLVDAVAADANNPMGGNTLSMAQGGAVGFADGGLPPEGLQPLPHGPAEGALGAWLHAQPRQGDTTPPQGDTTPPLNSERLNAYIRSPRFGDRVYLGPGAPPEAMEKRENMTPGQLVDAIFPYSASTANEGVFDAFLGPQLLRQKRDPEVPVSAVEIAVESVPSFLDQAARALSQVNAWGAKVLLDVGEGLITRSKTTTWNTISQIGAVNDALRRMPKVRGVSDEQVADTVRRIAEAATAGDPHISGDDLLRRIAEGLRERYETEPAQPTDPDGTYPPRPSSLPGPGPISMRLEDDPSLIKRPPVAGADKDPMGLGEFGGTPTGPDSISKRLEDDPSLIKRPPAAGTDVPAFRGTADWGTLTKYLAGGGPEDAPAAVVNKAADDIFSTALRAAKGEKFDAETLKTEIDALLPRTKDNPEMEGLLIAMMGAAIMGGKSPNAWTNIGDNVAKTLPALISFKGKQAEAERARDMTVAKLAIETKLSRETENRANIRGIEREQRASTEGRLKEARAEERKIRTEERKKIDYIVIEESTVPRSAFEEGAEGNMNIPVRTFLSLNESEKERASELGLRIVPLSRFSFKLDDILSAHGKGRLDPVETNARYMVNPYAPYAPFKEWGNDFKPIIRIPTAYGHFQYGDKNMMRKSDYLAFHRTYDRLQKNYRGLYNDLAELAALDPSKIVGTGSVKGYIGSALQGLGGYSKDEHNIFKEWGNALLGGQDVSDVTTFETKGRILMARLAAIILGESGKTISDADRVRVARTLGFEVDSQTNPDGSITFVGITGVNKNIFANPAAITAALNATSQIITSSLNKIHGAYQAEMDKIDINLEDIKDVIFEKSPTAEGLYFNLRKGEGT